MGTSTGSTYPRHTHSVLVQSLACPGSACMRQVVPVAAGCIRAAATTAAAGVDAWACLQRVCLLRMVLGTCRASGATSRH